MKQIRLIAVDLDGTLLRDDGTIAPEGAEALRKATEQGVHVVIATGRRLFSTQNFAAEIGITAPLIVCDGAQVFASPMGELWVEQVIPHDVALNITRYGDEQGWELATVIDSITYFRQRPGQVLGEFKLGVIIQKTNSDAVTRPPLRILAHEAEAIMGLSEYCQKNTFEGIRWQQFHNKQGMPYSICVFPKLADKGTALQYVCSKLDIPLEQTMAIGDYDNDLTMLQTAGISVAMGNAIETTKNAAQHIAPSNENEGIAWAVRQFALLEID